jgi:hypothetical protein
MPPDLAQIARRIEVEQRERALHAKSALQNVVVDHWNKMFAITRGIAAQGSGVPGLNMETLTGPYHAGNTIVMVQPGGGETPAPLQLPAAPAAPAPQPTSLLKKFAAAALIGSGLGTAGFGAFYGGYQLLKDQFKAPEVKPIDLQFRAKFDPDAGGLQVVPVEPPK